MKILLLPVTESCIRTQTKRRKVAAILADEVRRLYEAERAYKERIPENLMGSYRYHYSRRAEEDLFDAWLTLSEAFEPF
jgi:hypothetical protein